MTNGDRIRSMTDYELATFYLSRENSVCAICKEDVEGSGCSWSACSLSHRCDVFMRWLKSEYIPESDDGGEGK